MEIIYSDHNKDITIQYDIVEKDATYTVYKKHLETNISEIEYSGDLESCIEYVTNKIIG
jgi:hypothetical protein